MNGLEGLEEHIKWNWMQTYTGRRMQVGDPKPYQIHIRDIAHSLAMQVRYNGHCDRFYSVAEHCCHMFDMASDKDKLWALLHDASEAYLCDIPSPVKPLLTNYKALEKNLMRVIAEKFGLDPEQPASVHTLDTLILVDEVIQNLNPSGMESWRDKRGLGVKLQFWSPEQAEVEFLMRYYQEKSAVDI